jgi:uroporphyrinogen decarboxylase
MLEVNADAVAAYLNAQIDAGAQAVMVFDTWGGVLADGAFQRFSLHYTRQVVAALQREKDGARIPLHRRSPRAAGLWLEQIAGCGADVRRPGLDGEPRPGPRRRWTTASRCRATSTPTCCSRRPRPSSAEAGAVLDSFGAPAARGRPLGRRTSSTWATASASFTPPEHVQALVEAVHRSRPASLRARTGDAASPARE